jgi:hypothetical protein
MEFQFYGLLAGRLVRDCLAWDVNSRRTVGLYSAVLLRRSSSPFPATLRSATDS